ncbi:MAG TPA: histidine--tRNA ligase [Gemmatimonadaceae bacterium]
MAHGEGPLPGFRDFYPEQLAERAFVMKAWRTVADRFAFVEFDGPPLEPLELYTKKSGDEIVGQLYHFEDKGGRQVALRPEMTPTLARMVAAKANALRKPVRWFCMPQMFRYERQQRGRLREHYQVNYDIIGEADVTADAELLAVAIDIMREFGLTSNDVRARVSDRRILSGLLKNQGVGEAQLPGVFAVIDKLERQPKDVSREKLLGLGVSKDAAEEIIGLAGMRQIVGGATFLNYKGIEKEAADFQRYIDRLEDLGVSDWVDVDLTIVRGLAYYTGIVFELFDAKGELRAIAGGGRYDNLLGSLGGVELPACGFAMGDVVVTELLREKGLNVTVHSPDFWVASGSEAEESAVARVATDLRRAGASVEYALRKQQTGKQRKAAQSAGAAYFVTLEEAFSKSGAVHVEALGDEASSPLMKALADKPATLESLLAVLRSNPGMLV